MEIPKSFAIGGYVYRVRLTKNLTPRAWGQAAPELGTVQLATHWGKLPRTNYAMSETFWHEVVHCIMRDMASPHWADEAFVKAFSKRLNNVVHTAKLGG